jgi:hypothetical protein
MWNRDRIGDGFRIPGLTKGPPAAFFFHRDHIAEEHYSGLAFSRRVSRIRIGYPGMCLYSQLIIHNLEALLSGRYFTLKTEPK